MNMHHEHGGNGEDDGSSPSCPMIMTFHAGHCERILWSGWLASTVTEFVLSCLAIFVVAIGYEALKFLRVYLERRSIRNEILRNSPQQLAAARDSNSPLTDLREKTYLEQLISPNHVVQTLLLVIQVTISYLLMLIFMIFNYWLCLSVVLGLGVGYFFFGWIKRNSYDQECCY